MNFRHQLWMWLGRSKPFFNILKLIEVQNGGIEIVKRSSDIVIDGFPRCANTFAFVAFKLMQKEKISVAHHIHGPMQFIKGLKLGIPCLLLIRPPIDSVVSLLIREKNIDSSLAFENYIRFYNPLISHMDDLVVSDFDTTINHYEEVIRHVNRKFDRSFDVVKIDDQFMMRCKAEIMEMDKRDRGKDNVDNKKVGLPSKEKKMLKDGIRKRVESEIDKKLINDCEQVYQIFKENSLSS